MSDLEKVLAEVERRKQRAEQLGLPSITPHFYYDVARFYPVWRNNHPDIVPASISDVREVDKNGVEFRYQGQHYRLISEEHSFWLPDGDGPACSSTLRLLVDGTRVLEIDLHRDEFGAIQWLPAHIKSFIEGPWVPTFKALVAEAEGLYYADLQRAKKKEVEELGLRFGIRAEEMKDLELSAQAANEEAKPAGGSTNIVTHISTLLARFFGDKRRKKK